MQDHLGLFDTPPDRQEIRLSLTIVGVFFVAFLLILPEREVRLSEVDAFIPVIDSFMFLGELIIAALLYTQAAVFRSRALTVLATGYGVSALLDVAHALTFPGAFSPTGLLGAGLNSTAWIATFRRAALAIAIILYVQLKRADSLVQPGKEALTPRIGLGVFVAFALAVSATVLATSSEGLFPAQFVNRADVIYANALLREFIMIALFTVAAVMLFRARRSVLDTWLLVALSGWLIQSFLVTALHARFTVGWYWLFAIMLFSHLVVLFALIAESNRLYTRLARSTALRNQERDARLMSMDAVADAISHEVAQSLSASNMSVSAALDWLTRRRPEVGMAITSLHAAADSGHRAIDVVKSVRSMFGRGGGAAIVFDLNDLARQTATSLRSELVSKKISVEYALDTALPTVLADRVLLQRVILNLLTASIESIEASRNGAPRISIRSMRLNAQDVVLEISNNGIGISAEDLPHIFNAFVNTKPTGTGLGLSLCRTIVEEHGGRLWASQSEMEQGATFHLQLPRGGLAAH